MTTYQFAASSQTIGILDLQGDALAGASCRVLAPDGTLAHLYTDRTKTTTTANPTSATATGELRIFSDVPGWYSVIVTVANIAQPVRMVRVDADAADLAYASDQLDPGLLVHKAGAETVPGTKDFTGGLTVSGLPVETQQGAAAADAVVLAQAKAYSDLGEANEAAARSSADGVEAAARAAAVSAETAARIVADAATLASAESYADAGDSAEAATRAADDAATLAAAKAYADSVAAGLRPIGPPAAATSSITNVAALSGLQTIDGVVLLDGGWVLLLGQTSAVQDGPWVAHAGAWTRPTTFAAGSAAKGAYVFVAGGTRIGTGWSETATALVDTDPQTWSQFNTSTTVTGGPGITVADGVVAADFGATAGKVTQGDDGRLSDQRVPVDGSVTLAKFAQDMATQAELDAETAGRAAADALLVPTSSKDQPSGVPGLDSTAHLRRSELPDHDTHGQIIVLPNIVSSAALQAQGSPSGGHDPGDVARCHQGGRLFSLRVPVAAILSNSPTGSPTWDPTVYGYGNFTFAAGPAAALDDLLSALHDSPDAPRVKFMLQTSSDYPAWMYTSAAGAKQMRSFTKIQVGAGASAHASSLAMMLYWDPNHAWWYDYACHGFADWLSKPCPWSHGSTTWPHPRSVHLAAMQSSGGGLDHHTEMAESYEATSTAMVSGTVQGAGTVVTATVTSGINLDTAVATNWTVPTTIPVGTPNLPTEGLLTIHTGAVSEWMYYTSVTDDGAGHAVFHVDDGTIVHGSPHGVFNGRGWNGGTLADGAGSGPPVAWAAGLAVNVFPVDKHILGTAASRATWTLENDPARSDSGAYTGLFDAATVNQNSYARVGAQLAANSYPGYVRDPVGIPEKTGLLSPSTEANRVKLYARLWMDSIDTASRWFPDVPVIQYMGQAFGATGVGTVARTAPVYKVVSATVASQAAMLALAAAVGDVVYRTDINQYLQLSALPASSLGNWQATEGPLVAGVDYQLNGGIESANDAVTDYLSLPYADPLHRERVHIGHTDIDASPSGGTTWLDPGYWKRVNCTTWLNRGLRLAHQIKLGLTASDDIAVTTEWAWNLFGPDITAVENDYTRVNNPVVDAGGHNGWITAPTQGSGIPDQGLAAFPGTSSYVVDATHPANNIRIFEYVSGFKAAWLVTSQANMLGSGTTAAMVGDVAYRTDTAQYFKLTALPASTLGNWQLAAAADARVASRDTVLASLGMALRLKALDARLGNRVAANAVDAFQLRDKSVTADKLTFATLIAPPGARVEYRTAVPTDGTYGAWNVGDLIVYRRPLAGRAWGARCVAAGTPGVWQEYGALIETVNVAAASGAAVALPDVNVATVHRVTLTATTVTITLPVAAAGKSITVEVVQDAAGNRLAAWVTALWPGGTPPTLSTGGGKKDKVVFDCVDGVNWEGSLAGLDYR